MTQAVKSPALPAETDGRFRHPRRQKQILHGYRTKFPNAPDEELAVAATLALRIEQLQAEVLGGGSVDDAALASVIKVHSQLLNNLRGGDAMLARIAASFCGDDEEDDE